MGTPPRKGKSKNKDEKGQSNQDSDAVLSPLARSCWDSPPSDGGSNKKSAALENKLAQRKLYGHSGHENIENDMKDTSKKKCKRGRTTKDGSPKSASPHVGFSGLFPKKAAAKTSPNRGSKGKSLPLGPRLSKRETPFEDSLLSEQEGGSSQLHVPNSSTDESSKLAPKSSCLKKSSLPKVSLSPNNDVISPLRPPRNVRANDSKWFNEDFTLTPTVLYDTIPASANGRLGHYNHHTRPLMAPLSSSGQHYHQSPYWSGQVRINPFSPVPERYLRPPPTSTKSATRGAGSSRNKHPGFYKLIDLEPPTLPTEPHSEPSLVPRKKKSRLNPIIPSLSATLASSSSARPKLDGSNDDFFSEISPTDVTQPATKETLLGHKRKTPDLPMKPPPQSMDADPWQENDINKRMRIKRGRYLDDFQEVQFLGAGSFGSVNACLSRLDGCMYAIKSISPSGQIKKGNDITGINGQGGTEGAEYLYGGRKMMSNQFAIPPTPRRDMVVSPLKRKKTISRFGMSANGSEMADDCYNLDVLEGSSHWNEGALRRMLREVFALAALCQQDDVRTFHIVRYQQAWLEDDGTLYIQTELCSATLRDEMDGKVTNIGSEQSTTTSRQTLDVFRQLKVLREVLLALELLHARGMVHLDIKPENIFVKNNLYKLGDFGLANVFSKNDGNSAPDIEEGDSRYMSKDLLDFNPKDLTKCDIFSLGATLFEVMSGRSLPACGQEWQDLRNGKLPPLTGTMPCLNAIIKEMMHPDPQKRPTATDLLSREILRCEDDNPLLGLPQRGLPTSNTRRKSLKRSASWTL